MIVAFVLGLLIVQRLAELHYAERNRRRALAQGGVEHGADHYWMFIALHTLWFVGMLGEHVLNIAPLPSWWSIGLAGAGLLQIARYWVIRTLGPAWNTRVITWPGMPIAIRGPFRWVRHPNYVIVVLELALIPTSLGCWRTAMVVSILNAVLLLKIRLPVEEKALTSIRYDSETAKRRS
jgi:methyltransferase